MLRQHLDKNNLHHAYLIEGEHEEVMPEILEFLKILKINTIANPDFIKIKVDTFKIEDARNLKTYTMEKGFSDAKDAKKVFIISANNFLLEAQNSLLKLFEEPIANTHFFVVTPDTSVFVKTLLSRFFIITTEQALSKEIEEVKKFIAMPIKTRLDFIKELLTVEEPENDEGNEITSLNSVRAKSMNFLNALEKILHDKMSRGVLDISVFEHIFKVRQFLRQPGSSNKTLMESVALITPNFSN